MTFLEKCIVIFGDPNTSTTILWDLLVATSDSVVGGALGTLQANHVKVGLTFLMAVPTLDLQEREREGGGRERERKRE